MPLTRPAPMLAGLVGAAATALLSIVVGMTAVESLQLATYAVLASSAAGAVGSMTLVLSRRRSIGVQIAVVALTSVAAVAAGAVAAAGTMFISSHDLRSLGVVLAAAATIGGATALWLGQTVASSSRSLGAAARRIGDGEPTRGPEGIATVELAALAHELDDTSDRLARARERERALEGSRRELVAWVSHDLRTPLAGIRAMAEALEDGVVCDADTVARYHHALLVETDRLAGLVDDLFELSRINTGTMRLEMERVSLADLVSDALASADGIARAKGVKLEGRLAAKAPELDLSPAEMARVIRNLVENAIRHTPSDGTVSVEAGVDRRHAFVAVHDACGGIPSGDLERVFDVAFRGAAARSPGDERGGLGLAIARGIVEAHEGAIDVHNDGPGCRFVVRLPLTHVGHGTTA
ncbi:MAG: sensor histidine kinase [Actinomycetota bacterium]